MSLIDRVHLFEAAKTASEKNQATYSDFPVGAAILSQGGSVFCGANIEIASFPEGWCAETTAISHMVMAGQIQIREIAIFSPKKDLITPCGGCRQRIAEFGTAETQLHLCDHRGPQQTIFLKDIFPFGFSAEVLKS